MKILIIAYHFYPDVTPRAFRAFELVKQLAKEGHEVTILLPKSDFDYKDICEKYNFSVDFVDYKKTSVSTTNTSNNTNVKHFVLKKLVRKLFKKAMYCIFPSGRATRSYLSQPHTIRILEQQWHSIKTNI